VQSSPGYFFSHKARLWTSDIQLLKYADTPHPVLNKRKES
jgi:hypothetical protein